MIIGIINGYYRSGTTIWQRIAEELLDVVTVHEPTGPSTGYELPQYLNSSTHPFHGWNVFNGYRKIPKEILFKWYKRWSKLPIKGVVWPLTAALLLEPFDRMDEEVIVKCANIVDVQTIADIFDCWVINIQRDPAATTYAHVEIFPKAWQPKILEFPQFNTAFFVDDCYEKLGGNGATTVLEKLHYNLNEFYELTPPTHRFEEPKSIAKAMGVSWKEAKEYLDEKKLNPSLPKWFTEKWGSLARS